jgi:phage-related protein
MLANMPTFSYAVVPSDFLAESRSPIAAEGGKADIAKPFKGVDGGVFEIALKHRGDAFRTIYAVQIGDDIWVVDAFQKKSKSGIKTPQMDIDRIKERIKRLKEALR